MTANIGHVSGKQDENLLLLKEIWSSPKKGMTPIFIQPPTPRNAKQFFHFFKCN